MTDMYTRQEFDTLITVLGSTDASRRVGWAKYYEEADRAATAYYRMGLVAAFANRSYQDGASRRLIGIAIAGFIEQMLVDPEWREAFERGRRDLGSYLGARTDSELRTAILRFGGRDSEVEIRCPECRKMYAVIRGSTVETKCHRCQHLFELKTP